MSERPVQHDDSVTEAPESGDPTETGSASVSADVAKLQTERDDLFERLARATADFQNMRKRLETESDQRVAYANASLIKSLLPVIDNFERALAVDAKKSDVSTVLKGMQIVHDQWLSVLKNQQVDEIAPKAGDAFDPMRHEALMQQDSDKIASGAVVMVMQKGYALQDRVLRPAQVAVSKGKGE